MPYRMELTTEEEIADALTWYDEQCERNSRFTIEIEQWIYLPVRSKILKKWTKDLLIRVIRPELKSAVFRRVQAKQELKNDLKWLSYVLELQRLKENRSLRAKQKNYVWTKKSR